MTEQAPESSRAGSAKRLLLLLLLLAVAAPLAVVFLREDLQSNREHMAAGVLRSFVDAQALFREGDKEGDGVLDYAQDLEELGAVIGDALPEIYSGDYNGYTFEVLPGPQPEFTWRARATPLGQPWSHFYVDESGLVRVEATGPAGPESPPWKRPPSGP